MMTFNELTDEQLIALHKIVLPFNKAIPRVYRHLSEIRVMTNYVKGLPDYEVKIVDGIIDALADNHRKPYNFLKVAKYLASIGFEFNP